MCTGSLAMQKKANSKCFCYKESQFLFLTHQKQSLLPQKQRGILL